MNSNVCFLDEATYNKVKVARLNSMLLRICLFTQVWNIHQPCSSLPTLCASPPHESALLISSHGTHSYLRNTAAARLRSSWPRGATQSLTINCWSLPLSLRTVLGLCHAGAKQARKPCLQSEDSWDIHTSELSRELRLPLAELLLPFSSGWYVSWEHAPVRHWNDPFPSHFCL